jgi:hypothetical protein
MGTAQNTTETNTVKVPGIVEAFQKRLTSEDITTEQLELWLPLQSWAQDIKRDA